LSLFGNINFEADGGEPMKFSEIVIV